jgi:hypothetical protein
MKLRTLFYAIGVFGVVIFAIGSAALAYCDVVAPVLS